ncbi:MAG: GNAT family N-acetyltransferase [Acholeplasmataceae bacterium]|nr:GNAT family N-acetyltransferase [Acholeplasmataceae bacterium]
MIKVPAMKDFDSLYNYYKEKTLQEQVFVLIDSNEFALMIDQGFLYFYEVQSVISGFILSHFKDSQSYITMLYGDNHEIKNSLLKAYDSYMDSKGIFESLVHFFNPISLAWYPLKNIVHPCYQGVPSNHEDLSIYLDNGYIRHSTQETYYLDLNSFQMPLDVFAQIEKNILDGIEITFYNPLKHRKMIEFTNELNAPHWKKVIIENIDKPNPLPLLVALKDNDVIGFTGPLKIENNGRGYFAGIGVLETERGKKVGKTLFFMLCKTLKDMGASYMTLFTGVDNPARHIYISANFNVVRRFETMIKKYGNT